MQTFIHFALKNKEIFLPHKKADGKIGVVLIGKICNHTCFC